jgi:ABC-type Fe3+/spermidine/putrescine transport system ATPase subunit
VIEGCEMPKIELSQISKGILKNVSLSVEDREIIALVGPNGSGKTTLLNVIAGLVKYQGSVYFDRKNMDEVPAHRRGVGYLLQELALFPHLTVRENIEYGLKVQGYGKAVIESRVRELIGAFNIDGLSEKYPKDLSGGEKQRVAIARALAPFQKILLLDEPTSSLDPQTSKYLRIELKNILKRMGVTTIFVTHDLLGAEEFADRIAILLEGSIEQVSTPEELFFNPKTERISEFVGTPNVLSCDECRVLSPGLVEVRSKSMKIVLPYEGSPIKRMAISPHDIYVSNTNPPGPMLNRFRARIRDIIPLRSLVRVRLEAHGNIFLAELPSDTFREMNLYPGQEVYMIIKFRKIRLAE